ncbi:MAG: hypothetical protein WC798_02025 [Candidatus Paceibacterota bacterium]|jgi:hypothetical protein
MSKDWTGVPAGVLNAATQRFWVSLGVHAGMVATRITIDPSYLEGLATFAVQSVANTEKKILQPVYTLVTHAVAEFIAKDKFREGETTDGVSITRLGNNFEKNFLGKIEKNVGAAKLKSHNLLTAARDLSKDGESGIIPELGGKHEIALTHFFQLLEYKQQEKDFTWVVAYIVDKDGVLWTVSAGWGAGGDGWLVNAYSVVHSDRWDADRQVVSR